MTLVAWGLTCTENGSTERNVVEGRVLFVWWQKHNGTFRIRRSLTNCSHNLKTRTLTQMLFSPLYYVSICHHHHKHQGLDPLIRSVSRVTTALANVSSVFQLFSFLVVCSDMNSKGLGLVVFFASVKASSVCIRLSCPVCIQSAVHGVRNRLFCGHEGCSLPEVLITSFHS